MLISMSTELVIQEMRAPMMAPHPVLAHLPRTHMLWADSGAR